MLHLQDKGLYTYCSEKIQEPRKISSVGKSIAGFDLDWTIVRPVKTQFCKSDDDWAILPNRIDALLSIMNKGYTIAIFTNQKARGKKLEMVLARMSRIINFLISHNLDFIMLVSTEDNVYRKPEIGMFNFLQQHFELNTAHSFYVGDAAGRESDFSDSDYVFAQNVGVSFYTPEQVFPATNFKIPTKQSMLIFVGMPGAGKTTFYEKELLPMDWVHINQDTLKTFERVKKEARKNLAEGFSVAIDGTNPTAEKRRELISIASEFSPKISVQILYFVDNGHERNKLRTKPVPQIAYNMYYKNLVEPSLRVDGVPVTQMV